MNALLRVRTVLAAIAMFIVSAVAGSIFDDWVWSLAIAVAVPLIITLVTMTWPLGIRLTAQVVGVIVAVGLVVAVEGGTTSDVVDAFGSGIQQLLTTEWPSPLRPSVVGAVAVLLALGTSSATLLSTGQRWHLLPLAPVLVTYVIVVGLSAPAGLQLGWLIPLGAVGGLFAALRPTDDLRERWMLLRGERRLAPLVLVAALIAGAISIPVALTARADPRRNDPAELTAALLDPIESTLALRALDPINLHEIEAAETALLPARWRTAALSDYDGQRWTPELTLRPIGRRLASTSDPTLTYDITFLDDDLILMPLPGTPITIDADVETDADRTVVRLTERPDDNLPIEVTAEVAPTTADAVVGGIAARPVDDSVSGLTEFATGLAGEGTILEQLRRIESTMRDDWVLAPDAPGGGMQRALIERFMRDTQRGTAEQFATSYVLLVRSLGVDARVATGFAAAASPVNGRLTLTSADAAVWPEVRLVDGGWFALDPVPTEETTDSAPPDEEPAVQTPAAAQPPIAPPPEPTDDSLAGDDIIDDDGATTLSSIGRWLRNIGVGFAALLMPVLIAAIVILGLKRRRRRRRLATGTAAERVVGAWAVATDRLVDAGLDIKESSTNGDIAVAGAPLAETASRELERLATLSSAVTFGHPARADLLVEDAAACLGHVENTMAGGRSRTDRWRWRLSLRSLRRSTRSPVDH